ncbi:ergothioneine biosynthesis glutamate--cysteine ligase EgtA [Streptomyces nigra]|uniref:ergothioneine biosynthesis glutamate--cysteine ligase EgtA n=1 Tax=Streptomyces nigra TaxID=1827580 RepID=UPI0038223368
MSAQLLEEEAEAYVRGVCFKNGPPERIGVELEWLVQDRFDQKLIITVDRLDAALAPVKGPGSLPGGSTITREPGGQIEISSPPATTVAECIAITAADLAVLRQTVECAGLVLVGRGLDPYREPPRVVEHPRYLAMERYFDREGSWGRTMMRRTASVQVNLDSGDTGDGTFGQRFRWQLVHRLGPVLVAAFANSPLSAGRPTGWASTRQATWARMDPGRTRPVGCLPDPATSWARYALDAQLLCLPGGAAEDWTAPVGLTFRDWMRGGRGLRAPSIADLDYHLSTLFPPVRPRGWLELRMIDAQDGDNWMAAAAVASILLDDPAAAETAYAATAPLCGEDQVPTPETWLRAARRGLADLDLAKAARTCFAAADAALGRAGTPDYVRTVVADYANRYPERGRCPADDLLDVLSRA